MAILTECSKALATLVILINKDAGNYSNNFGFVIIPLSGKINSTKEIKKVSITITDGNVSQPVILSIDNQTTINFPVSIFATSDTYGVVIKSGFKSEAAEDEIYRSYPLYAMFNNDINSPKYLDLTAPEHYFVIRSIEFFSRNNGFTRVGQYCDQVAVTKTVMQNFKVNGSNDGDMKIINTSEYVRTVTFLLTLKIISGCEARIIMVVTYSSAKY